VWVLWGTKEDESSSGLIWAAGFHHVTAHSRLARVLQLTNRLLNFPNFFSGHTKPQIIETTDTESAGTEAQLYHYYTHHETKISPSLDVKHFNNASAL
jgi:hypothetical protein